MGAVTLITNTPALLNPHLSVEAQTRSVTDRTFRCDSWETRGATQRLNTGLPPLPAALLGAPADGLPRDRSAAEHPRLQGTQRRETTAIIHGRSACQSPAPALDRGADQPLLERDRGHNCPRQPAPSQRPARRRQHPEPKPRPVVGPWSPHTAARATLSLQTLEMGAWGQHGARTRWRSRLSSAKRQRQPGPSTDDGATEKENIFHRDKSGVCAAKCERPHGPRRGAGMRGAAGAPRLPASRRRRAGKRQVRKPGQSRRLL